MRRWDGASNNSTMWDERHADLLMRAAELHEANRQLNELFEFRPAGPPGLTAAVIKASVQYKERLNAYRMAMERFYSPTLLDAVETLSAHDRSGVAEALVFLEADPWCFRSGYLKQRILCESPELMSGEGRGSPE